MMAAGVYSVQDDLRVVLLGKGGAGKSSLADRLLGGKVLYNKETGLCVWKQGEHDGKKITVVDAPGWDTASGDHTPEQIKQEIVRSATLCLPGPHALLLVLPISADGEVPSDEEIQSHIQHTQLLSEEAWSYTMVLFACEGEVAKSVIDQHLKAAEELLKKCAGRHFILKKGTTVPELMQKINNLVSGNSEDCLPLQDYHGKIISENTEWKRQLREEKEEMRQKSNCQEDGKKMLRRSSSEILPPAFGGSKAVPQEKSNMAFLEDPKLTLITFALVGGVLGVIIGATDGAPGSGLVIGFILGIFLAIVMTIALRFLTGMPILTGAERKPDKGVDLPEKSKEQ